MLKMIFDTSDIPDNKYYRDVEVTWKDCSQDDLNGMLQHFEDFLVCLGYPIHNGEIQWVKEDENHASL